MENNNIIRIDNTRFIFATNFSGDPSRDNFGRDDRHANIIIPDYKQAEMMIDMGLNVRQTKPKDGEEEGFEPTYFVDVKANYDSEWPPKIYLVSGDADPVPLDQDSVGSIDMCYVMNVNAILNVYRSKKYGTVSLYIRTMYVEQDVEDDPYAAQYANRRKE